MKKIRRRQFFIFASSQLTVLTGKTVLLNSVQELIEIDAWLLLIFFIYLHIELNSINSIITCKRVKVFEKGDPSIRQKMDVCSFRQLLRLNLRWFLS